MNVSAVIVTRGDVDLSEILESWPAGLFDEVVIWTNGGRVTHMELASSGEPGFGSDKAPELGVYGRYAAIEYALHPVIFVQDDDCIVPAAEIVGEYEPGRLVANMPVGRWPDYPDSTLVGWGAVFDRDLPAQAFEKWSARFPRVDWDRAFLRDCDVVFSALSPRTVHDFGFQHLPWAELPERAMHLEPGHGNRRADILRLARIVRTWPDDDRRNA